MNPWEARELFVERKREAIASDKPLTIRERARRGRVREDNYAYSVWTEWQVVHGRKIIRAYDFQHQAEALVAEIEAARESKP